MTEYWIIVAYPSQHPMVACVRFKDTRTIEFTLTGNERQFTAHLREDGNWDVEDEVYHIRLAENITDRVDAHTF